MRGLMGIRDLKLVLARLTLGPRKIDGGAEIRSEFDEAFYLERSPDVRQSSIDPLRHYLETGWKEGRDPAPWFSSTAYLQAYDDVRRAGANPFVHYIRFGRGEGRSAGVRLAAEWSPGDDGSHPADAASGTANGCEADRMVETIAPHFDVEFYLAVNSDVAEEGIDPVRHYVTEGWREGRDPSPTFSTRYYLETNPDVRAEGLNPFWHFIVTGKEENRLPAEPGGYKAQFLKTLLSLEQTVDLWRSTDREFALIDRASLVAVLKRSIAPGFGRVIVSFTQDNYREIVGGEQLCVSREEAAVAAAGHCYLALHPWQPLPRLAAPEDALELPVSLVLNGEFLGTSPIADVTAAIAEAKCPDTVFTLVIHSLLGHAPEAVAKMARVLDPDDAWFWLHDNFSICPSYALQRNGITYCGAPAPTSQACGICVYGEERRQHLPRIRELFAEIDFTVVAPSQAEHALWTEKSGIRAARSIVLPHLSLDWSGVHPPIGHVCGTPVKVAFIGVASAIKGWPVFERLAETCVGLEGYEFYYFGVSQTDSLAVTARHVSVTGDEPTTMRDALMGERIDLFLQWSSCPETFSFSTYEALAAGAAVVTHPGTGNVATIVRETGRGKVLENQERLLEFFTSGEARALAESNRRTARRGASFAFSRMTIDLIEGEGADGDPLLHKLLV